MQKWRASLIGQQSGDQIFLPSQVNRSKMLYLSIYLENSFGLSVSIKTLYNRSTCQSFFLSFFRLYIASNVDLLFRVRVDSVFTSKEHRKVGLWRVWHFCHTLRLCSWRHWPRLLGTKRRHPWSAFRDSPSPVYDVTGQEIGRKTTASLFFFFFFSFVFHSYLSPCRLCQEDCLFRLWQCIFLFLPPWLIPLACSQCLFIKIGWVGSWTVDQTSCVIWSNKFRPRVIFTVDWA